MDVRRAVLDRLVKNQIDVADDRRGVRLRLEALQIDASPSVAEAPPRRRAARGSRPCSRCPCRSASGSAPRSADGRDDHLDFLAEGEAQILRGLRIQRVGEARPECSRRRRRWGRRRAAAPARRGCSRTISGRRLEARQVHIVRAERSRRWSGRTAPRCKSGNRPASRAAICRCARSPGDVVDLAAVDHALLDEEFEDLFCVHVWKEGFVTFRAASASPMSCTAACGSCALRHHLLVADQTPFR